MIRFLYSSGIIVYTMFIRLASLFGIRKAKQWVGGRKKQKYLFQEPFDDNRYVWFHASSLGEFEQGRPLIEEFRKHFPQYKILLTFFSPSGFEIRKNYPGADVVLYLPADTVRNARKFLLRFRPEMAFFVKYDFWMNYIYQLRRMNIPTYLVSGIFRPAHYMFRSYGKWALNHLEAFEKLFVQDESSHELLEKNGITNSIVCGDTRFDRVVQVAASGKSYENVERFIEGKEVLVMGSSWIPDERFLQALLDEEKDLKVILVPHETHDLRIEGITRKLNMPLLKYTELNESSDYSSRILIINTIGMLSSLYKYAKVAHIGNGFGSGIHNTLEAAVFGVPTIFGPNYQKFREAVDLIKIGGAFTFSTESQYLQILHRLFHEPEYYHEASRVARNYVGSNAGATVIITNYLKNQQENRQNQV